MKTIFSLLLLCVALSAHGATYMLLSQTNTFANNITKNATNAANAYADSLIASTGAVGITIDGGGLVIATGVKGYITVPYACTLYDWTLLADQSGSAVVDVWKCTYAQFDAGATHPVAGDKITASAPPTILTSTKGQSLALSTWTTNITAGEVLAFNVTSCSSITRLNLTMKVAK